MSRASQRAPASARFFATALGGAAFLFSSQGVAQDDLSSLDDLDAELAELDGGAAASSSSGPRIDEFSGFLAEEFRFYPADRGSTQNDQQLITEAQIDLDVQLVGGLHAVAVPWFVIDALDTELLRYEPLEAYLTYRAARWDVLAGQFIESWGIADTSNPLDVLNRRDLATDLFDPQIRGELGARVRWTLPSSDTVGEPTFSVYALPLWRDTEFPTESQRFAFSAPPAELDLAQTQGPADINRALAAIRFDHTLDTSLFSADLQYLVSRGPSRAPLVAAMPRLDGSIDLIPQYFGHWVMGGGLRAVPEAPGWSKFTLKLEVAYKRPYVFSRVTEPDEADTSPPPSLTKPDDYVQIVGGFDRTFVAPLAQKDELTMTVEFAGEVGASANDAARLLRPFDSDLALRLAWTAGDFARTTIEARGIVDVSNGEVIAEGLAARQLRFIHDDLKLELSGRWLRASPQGGTLLGAFPTNNSSLHARLQWDF